MCVCILAKKKESMASMKKASKSYAKLEEEEEQHKAQIASCETKDIRARQVSAAI